METLTLNVGLEQEYKTDIANKLNVLLAALEYKRKELFHDA